jgi:membrane-anchored protein YejM (alkaline phosphatase superfamily)
VDTVVVLEFTGSGDYKSVPMNDKKPKWIAGQPARLPINCGGRRTACRRFSQRRQARRLPYRFPAARMRDRIFVTRAPIKQSFTDAILYGLLSLPLALVITLPLLRRAIADANGLSFSTALMFLSTLICLFTACVVVWLTMTVIRLPRLLVVIAAVVMAAALQLYLFTDVRVFSIFKFHINGFVLNFLTTEGATDSLKMSTATLAWSLMAVLLVIGAQVFLARIAFYKPDALNAVRRGAVPLAVALIGIVIVDKGMFAYADLTNKVSVLTTSRYFPLYGKVTVKHLAALWFGFKVDREKDVVISDAGKTLNYPRHPLQFAPGAPHYNVVYLLADGFRSDMLTPDVTPHLYAFAQHNLDFREHFSGGNGTRFGVFSMLYGVYGTLWHSFLAARESPAMLDALQRLNYQFTILDSTKLTFPEFRKTAFVKLADFISDDHPEPEMWKRDADLVAEFHQFLERRDHGRPFFAFIFFNSSHPFYQYPKQFEQFTPVVEAKINYLSEITPAKALGLKHRYMNALHYSDALFQEVLDDLRGHNVFDDTILIITGDHGEEFMENRYYSHNSAFDDYQTKTTMVMHIPGEAARKIKTMTSHLDLAPTILTRIGCTNPPEDYSHGRDILSTAPRQFLFCTDWDNGAIMTETERAIVPVGSAKLHFLEVRDAQSYRPITDKDEAKKFRPMMLQVAQGLAEFVK